jgi:hypothetical protein
MKTIVPMTGRGGIVSLLVLTMLLGGPAALRAADAPRIRLLRTQQVGDVLYFHVRFEIPTDMDNTQPTSNASTSPVISGSIERAHGPRLVPQDEKVRAVYRRVEDAATPATVYYSPPAKPVAVVPASDQGKAARGSVDRSLPAPPGEAVPVPAQRPVPAPVEGLEFVGKATQPARVKLLLLYPRRQGHTWAEVPVTLDLATAQKVAAPPAAQNRQPGQPPSADELEGLWAVGQMQYFANLETLTSDSGFFGFARDATSRKYGLLTQATPGASVQTQAPQLIDWHLYETTTGAAAITESLQRQRMLNPGTRDQGPRNVEIARVPGIDIAEHPWKEMIGTKKPAIEPLARLVPRDNYYLHFNSFSKLLELSDLIDRWGASLLSAYEINSRDLRLRARYERQLCLRSTALGRLLGPAVIESLAVTGSDFYLREGSDVTVLFHVRNRDLFRAAVEPFLAEARQTFAGRLQEGRGEYEGLTIESFTTPLREVSLHRAFVGDVVVYSNSLAAVRRVIDTHRGRLPALADSLDFQYMRTTFRRDDPEEDGFLFLSDPFIRQFVGPASKIKEKRRLEALTSLAMVTNGVLFSAWESGPLTADQRAHLTASGLKPDEVYTPGGRDVAWDASQHAAVSDVYNTLAFATPLIELPIERVTAMEAESYGRFRAQYLGLWRQYFDPVGMRFALRDGRVRLETYILPLVQSSAYNALRQEVGDGTTTLDPTRIPPQCVVQFLTHLNPNGVRAQLARVLSLLEGRIRFDLLGDWFLVRFDDSPVYGKLAELLLRDEDDERPEPDQGEVAELLFQVPVTAGVGIGNPLLLAGLLGTVRTAVLAAAPDLVTWEPMEPAYKGVSIVRIQARGERLMKELLGDAEKRKAGKPFEPALYYATMNRGFYIGPSEAALKAFIDENVARPEDKRSARKSEAIPVNSSLYLAPGAAAQAGVAMRAFVEQQVGQRALANEPILHVLYHTGLVDAAAPPKQVEDAALTYFGFVPVSPDGAPYSYDPMTDEVSNRRHGSLRRPAHHPAPEPTSAIGQLLEEVQRLRADLRFREDGIQTVLTLERKAPGK